MSILDDAIVWIEQARSDARTAEYVARAGSERDRLRKALEDCARHSVNFDTCGVCGLHIEDCNRETAFVGDIKMFECAGARARASLGG